MRILGLQGSPRGEGNTQATLDLVLEGARQEGAAADVIRLCDLTELTGCMECFACQGTTNQPGCAVEDDMQQVIEKAVKAQVIVWATPVFCWSPSWLLKMAMDRMYCMFKFQPDSEVTCLLEGRKTAAVITAGGTEDDGADLIIETCRRFAEFSKNRWLGALVAANVTTPSAIREDAKLVERALSFGRQLAS